MVRVIFLCMCVLLFVCVCLRCGRGSWFVCMDLCSFVFVFDLVVVRVVCLCVCLFVCVCVCFRCGHGCLFAFVFACLCLWRLSLWSRLFVCC